MPLAGSLRKTGVVFGSISERRYLRQRFKTVPADIGVGIYFPTLARRINVAGFRLNPFFRARGWSQNCGSNFAACPRARKGLVATLRVAVCPKARKGLERKAHRPAIGRVEDLERKARFIHTGRRVKKCARSLAGKNQQPRGRATGLLIS
jgi:hypothetical protein